MLRKITQKRWCITPPELKDVKIPKRVRFLPLKGEKYRVYGVAIAACAAYGLWGKDEKQPLLSKARAVALYARKEEVWRGVRAISQ